MLSTLQLFNLFLIFVRILAVFMSTPIFNSRSIPTLAKIGLAGLLSIIFLPLLEIPSGAGLTVLPTNTLSLVLMIAQEVLVGVLIGFVTGLVFTTVSIAASMMSLQVGFRSANLFDPFINTPTAALEQFYTLLAIALFLNINGHHWFIQALARTFQVLPLGSFVLDQITIERLVMFTGEIFISATRIALPVMGTLLLTDLGLGLIARAVPQIQVFFLGLPVKIGLGLVTLAFTLVLTAPLIKQLFSEISSNILAIGVH
ncbi:MAG TPA: flagellar biosynthetic protein FliR [Anaerolineae bacterium]|nr:flagellar biosynthetic protein FliR [Anaerolineae bacterium]